MLRHHRGAIEKVITTAPKACVVGLQIFHNGKPIELLYRVGGDEVGQIWHVKPLFVEGPECDVTIYATDRCSRLHTQTAF
jgi:hypothetical protein